MFKLSLQRRAYLCFFLSGAAGLIYEVVWARQLGLFLGITTYAHTAVITAYMAGLAAGSFYLGAMPTVRRSRCDSTPGWKWPSESMPP